MFELFPLPPHALDTFECGSETEKNAARFQRINIWGNGTCFFHSVACLLANANESSGNTITYHLAIPSNKNLPSTDTIAHSSTKQTVQLAFTVPNRYDSDRHFYKNFEQVGLQLRQYLSQTVTEERFAQFLEEGFSSDLKWALASTMPDWVDVKKQLATPSQWADIWTIKYAAWTLSVNLLFINGSSREEPIFCGVENFENGPWTLFIYWSGKVHFEPIVQIHPETHKCCKVFSTTHPFVQCLKQRFESSDRGGCKLKVNPKQ